MRRQSSLTVRPRHALPNVLVHCEFCVSDYKFSEWTATFPNTIPAFKISSTLPPTEVKNPWYYKAGNLTYYLYKVTTASTLAGLGSEQDRCGSCPVGNGKGQCTAPENPQALSHWEVVLPSACEGTVSSPTSGGSWVDTDKSSCATGYKWEAPGNSGPGQTMEFLLTIKGNYTDASLNTQNAFVVKGATRTSWSNITSGTPTALQTLKGPTCTPCSGAGCCISGKCCDPQVTCCYPGAPACPPPCDPVAECCDGVGKCTTNNLPLRITGTAKWSIGESTAYDCGNAVKYGGEFTPLQVKLTYTKDTGASTTLYKTVSATGTYDFTINDFTDADTGRTVTVELVGTADTTAWTFGPALSARTVTVAKPIPSTSYTIDTAVARPFQVSGDVYVVKSSAPASPATCVVTTVRPNDGATKIQDLPAVGGALTSPSAAYAAGFFSTSVPAPSSTGSVATSVSAIENKGYAVSSNFKSSWTWTAADFYNIATSSDLVSLKDNRCFGTVPDACVNVVTVPVDVSFTGSIKWDFKDELYGCSSVTVELQKKVSTVWTSFATAITAMTSTGTYTITVPKAQFDELDVGASYQVVIKDMGTKPPGTDPVAGTVGTTTIAFAIGTTTYPVTELKVTRQFPVALSLRYDLEGRDSGTPVCSNLDKGFPAVSGSNALATLVPSGAKLLSVALDGNGDKTTNVNYGDSGAVDLVIPSQTNLVPYEISGGFNIDASTNLCSASYPVCITCGVKDISATGKVQWYFPNDESITTAFTCEAVPVRLRLKNTPFTVLAGGVASPVMSSTTDGTFSFTGIKDIVPGTELTVEVMKPDGSAFDFASTAPWDFLDDVKANTVTKTYSFQVATPGPIPADPVKVTRKFKVEGTLRYDLRASPSKDAPTADKCTDLDATITEISASFPKFPDVPTYAKVYIGQQCAANALTVSASGTFSKSDIELGTSALAATLTTSSNLLDTNPASFRTDSGNLMDLFKADLCAASTPVCLTVGLKPASVCGQTKWELNNNVNTADLSLEKVTTCFSDSVTLSATLGTVSPTTPTVVGNSWCFTVNNIPPGSSVTPSMAASNADPPLYTVLTATTVPVQDAFPITTTPVSLPTPFYITRTFKLQGPVDFDFRAGLPLDTCPTHANWPSPDNVIKVTSTVTGTDDIYTASNGLFTVPAYSFASSDVTFTVGSDDSTPSYFVFDASKYKKTRDQSVTELITAFGQGNMCANTDIITVPCVTLGLKTTQLSGQAYIEINTPTSDKAVYEPAIDRLFPECAIKVEITASGPGAFIIVNNAPVTTATVTTSGGAFSATVVAGGSYKVDVKTFDCDESGTGGANLKEVKDFFSLVTGFSDPTTANLDPVTNTYRVLFPYTTSTTPPSAGCGHTLGFWKNQAANCLISYSKTQYTRAEFLPIINSLIPYKRSEVLNFDENPTWINACVQKGASLAKCQEDWKYQYAVNIFDDERTDLAKLLRQLLSNEIAHKAGYSASPAWMVSMNHYRGEYVAWKFATEPGSFSAAYVNDLASYFDKLNNLDPKPCAANLINSAPGTQTPLPVATAELSGYRRHARRMAF